LFLIWELFNSQFLRSPARSRVDRKYLASSSVSSCWKNDTWRTIF